MQKFLLCALCVVLTSCGLCRHLPPETNVSVRDSVNVIIRDSINWIPKEKIVDVVPTYDTLKMETSLAKAKAYVDTTTHTLKGNLENKEGVEKHHKLEYRYVEKRDTTYIKVPVEVIKEKKYIPKFFWGTFVFSVLVLLVFAVKIYLKIKTGAIQLPKPR